MNTRTIILFGLLIVVGIVGAAFAFLYTKESNFFIDRYVDKIASCSNISDRTACFDNEKCEGVYVPAGPGEPVEFIRCQEVPEKFAAEYQIQKTLCIQTEGKWLRTSLGNFCECNEVGALKVFDEELGCIKQ